MTLDTTLNDVVEISIITSPQHCLVNTKHKSGLYSWITIKPPKGESIIIPRLYDADTIAMIQAYESIFGVILDSIDGSKPVDDVKDLKFLVSKIHAWCRSALVYGKVKNINTSSNT